MSKTRIDNLRKDIVKANLDGYVVTNLDQVRYLCGYSGSNGLLVVTPKQAFFLTDFRYGEQAAKEVKGAKRTICTKGDLLACLAELTFLNKKNARYGFDNSSLTVARLASLKSSLPDIIHSPFFFGPGEWAVIGCNC